MQTKNNFSDYDRIMFQDSWKCWWCETNQADCLHHIVGRGSKNGDVESSPLNAAFMCNQKCHLQNHGLITTKEWKVKLLKMTYDYLISTGYTLTEKDNMFIEKYSEYYFFLK